MRPKEGAGRAVGAGKGDVSMGVDEKAGREGKGKKKKGLPWGMTTLERSHVGAAPSNLLCWTLTARRLKYSDTFLRESAVAAELALISGRTGAAMTEETLSAERNSEARIVICVCGCCFRCIGVSLRRMMKSLPKL